VLPDFVESRLRALPRGLRDHIARTRDLARELARIHGVDEAAAGLAAACHDLARALSPAGLLDEAERLSLPVLPVERRVPILLHGPVAAAWLEAGGDVRDPRVLDAVRWHTTGRVGMDAVEKVLFAADKAEPEKVRHNPALAEVHDLAASDLDRAILRFLDLQMAVLIASRQPMHPRALDLRNHLLTTLSPNEPE